MLSAASEILALDIWGAGPAQAQMPPSGPRTGTGARCNLEMEAKERTHES